MNNNYNYNFNPNPSFMRSPATFMPNMVNSAPVRMIPQATITIPRISSLLGGAKVGTAGAAASGASKITFSGILNGASKTLGVINQAIPVFYQVKPIWNNARTMFRVVKEINSKDEPSAKTTSNNATNQVNSNQKNIEENNAPTFFA